MADLNVIAARIVAHLRAHGGAASLNRLARDLGCSSKAISEAARRLVDARRVTSNGSLAAERGTTRLSLLSREGPANEAPRGVSVNPYGEAA